MFLDQYKKENAIRESMAIEALPLDVEKVISLCNLLKETPIGLEKDLLDLFINRILPGVDDSSKIKAEFLDQILKDKIVSTVINKEKAIEILGTMKGGYNVKPLIDALEDEKLAKFAVDALENIIMVYDSFSLVKDLCDKGNKYAQDLMQRWSLATWFTKQESISDLITLKVFKVTGEVTTDDLSPATDAWSRPDIPLHALSMFKNSRDDLKADEEGVRGPIKLIQSLKEDGYPLVYVGDVVGTGSSRKSATNSLLYHIGEDIPFVPNKKQGGFVFGGKIAPIFYNTLEDSGALPIEMDVSNINQGDLIDLKVYEGKVYKHGSNEVLATFTLKTNTLLDEFRARGRINLIIGKTLTKKACDYLQKDMPNIFAKIKEVKESSKGFTRAQKIVGLACNKKGVRPHEYCEVKISTVGSQDTTGPMTRDELKDLSCLKFSSEIFMQSFCHTAAYPKEVDVKTHNSLPSFIINRGGIALKPGDGVIHCFLNRMALPDTVGTGGDSHTRMPIGISFAAGSGLVAFAGATGMMPLDMPESILVRFKGTMQDGITLRDLVHAIPYFAIKNNLLTVDKKNKINAFSGKILEIEGLEHLDVEHAFELADASAERSAAACAIRLSRESVCKYLKSNSAFLRKMADEGYLSKEALLKRADEMDKWIENGSLIEADEDCEYANILEIDLNELKEPILCAPNDPDDVKLLSEVANTHIDEVFIGSCMTNIGHYRAAAEILKDESVEVPTRLWVAPPTKMDKEQLTKEGIYSIFGRVGARIEIPGCSLCMGNQARVHNNATVVSTSTRNFPNRLGKGANVYLASAELSSICAKLGRIPTFEEYKANIKVLIGKESKLYKLLDFSK